MDLASPALQFFDTRREADEAVCRLHATRLDVGRVPLAPVI